MSVDLSKCKVGDRLKKRNGATVTVINVLYTMTYPILCDDCYSRTYSGRFAISETDHRDIVSVCKPDRKRVASVYVETTSFQSEVVVLFGNFRWTGYYANRRNALRGARRFCALIGFKCEVVK